MQAPGPDDRRVGMTLVPALFKGGTWDGEFHDVVVAASIIVPKNIPQTLEGAIEELTYIIIGDDGMPVRRMRPYAKQTYRLAKAIRDAAGVLEHLVYELESVVEVYP